MITIIFMHVNGNDAVVRRKKIDYASVSIAEALSLYTYSYHYDTVESANDGPTCVIIILWNNKNNVLYF